MDKHLALDKTGRNPSCWSAAGLSSVSARRRNKRLSPNMKFIKTFTVATCAAAFLFCASSLMAGESCCVKAKAKVGPGTTRHLETVKWTIDNVMASEPDMPLWAGFSNNEIPVELGKLLTGQDYGGDAKKCMDNVAGLIDKSVEEAGLL